MKNFKKRDRTGQEIRPGDLCVYDNSLVVYKKISWGGEGSKGQYGQFITADGVRSVKYTNVIFAFDPLSERKNQSDEIKALCRKFYEGE